MNLQQIETFVCVAETGSFSKAAQQLDIAQPALSRQVRALEIELRETLLFRTGRGVALTDAGRRLLEHGHGIMQRVALAKEDLGSHRGEPVGRIVLGLPPSLMRLLTLPLINHFSKEMPKARLAVVEGFSMHISEWLATGRMDLGLVYTPDPNPQIEVVPVLEEPLCVIGRAQDLQDENQVVFKDLSQMPLIMPQRGQIFRKLMEAQATLSQVQLNVVWEVSSVPAILDLVRSGYGYAVLTASAVNTAQLEDGLKVLPIVDPRIVCTLCLVQSSKKHATPLVRCTADILRTLCLARA
ncbi:LysR family transcriptional regulator [Comamonas aquatica]|uniref:LysR family transcriptional regulator n=1 Tax=Comamonas TaxID=283 RepID=UPI0012AE3CF1|nr:MULTISPECIES: LysR family transcriptional regulator [Comamonas]MDH0496208.1 LysR family transcriptional regulator [Comamonas aquatica]MDH0901115.1 LysR family transcriptional regulator [Comamonas aquatica]MRT22209.1 LysR family transcriptional regulator [Comamonas sp. CAH-2]WBM43068.1 LysR family transcriptional regulator [Comamonas aquatica]